VERPVRVGDIVTLSGHEGEVMRIGFRSITIRTFDKQEVFIPNGSLISGELVNWTRSDDILRTVLSVGIGYQDDPDRAIVLVREILVGYALVLSTPGPLVALWEFGDSAILLRVEYYVHFLGQVGRTQVRSEVNRRIWYGFQAAGISIPFPQRDLHVYPTPGGETLGLSVPVAAARSVG
jgi:potassium efflux system protein